MYLFIWLDKISCYCVIISGAFAQLITSMNIRIDFEKIL